MTNTAGGSRFITKTWGRNNRKLTHEFFYHRGTEILGGEGLSGFQGLDRWPATERGIT
jgi:hypothetical protein